MAGGTGEASQHNGTFLGIPYDPMERCTYTAMHFYVHVHVHVHTVHAHVQCITVSRPRGFTYLVLL